MHTKPQTRADLFREYARVIEMCEGTDIDPKQCVRHEGVVREKRSIEFVFDDTPTNYDFAVTIIDNEPVFSGTTVYGKRSKLSFIVAHPSTSIECGFVDTDGFDRDSSDFTLQKPRIIKPATYQLLRDGVVIDERMSACEIDAVYWSINSYTFARGFKNV